MQLIITVLNALMLYSALSLASSEQFLPYDYGFDHGKVLRRQPEPSSTPITVGRLSSINGSVPIRPEIRQLRRDPLKWNLFLLALSMMQYMDQAEELSWYQLTGKAHRP